MKKIISLLLAVAMIASLSIVSFAADANAAGGMHTVITETETDITVDVYVNNVVDCSSITSYIVTDAVTFVDGSAVVGAEFEAATLTPTTNKAGYIKFVLLHTDAANFFTDAGSVKALSYKVAKVDPAATLSEADFAYSTSSIKVSKVVTASTGTVAGLTAGNNFTTAKQPAYFTIAYVDDRTPTPDPDPIPDPIILGDAAEVLDSADVVASEATETAEGKGVLTFAGKVKAPAAAEDYGVIVNGRKFFGAKSGDMVSDGNGGVTEFVFGSWDGTFEIILNNITNATSGNNAGAKAYQYFVGEKYTNAANVTVE